MNILARRALGISERQAAASLHVRSQQLLRDSVPPHYSPEHRRQYLASRITTSSGQAGVDYFLRQRFGPSLYAATGICAAIMLIGCANLINLLLARSSKRRREVAVRFALGAKRSQIAALFATESLLLVVAGAALGLLLAQAIDWWLLAEGARMFGNFDLGLSFDWRTNLFLAAAVSLIGMGCAGASAWQADRMRFAALRESARGIVGINIAPQKILLGLQVALTLALVAGSSLLTASLNHLYAADLGVKTRNVWDVKLAARPEARTNFSRGPYYRDMLNAIHQIPEVQSATLTNAVPFFTLPVEELVAGVDTGRAEQGVIGVVLSTSAEFFDTLGIKVVAGTGLEERDSGEPSVVVSQSLAALLAPAPNELIGHHIRLGTDARYSRLRVTGVVSNAQINLAHPEQLAPATAYLNIWQHPDQQGYPVLLIKTATNTFPVEALRKIVDPHGREYVDRVRTLSEEKDSALMENKLLAYLSGAFSGLALAVAAAGLFGLLSYQVANRTSEIGVRMALGARGPQIEWLILRQVLAVVALGIGLGLVASLAVARVIQGLLFGVNPYDPWLLAISCSVLSATALLAAWLPARQASYLDPLTALRLE